MKATQRNLLLLEFSESIKTNDRILWNLRKRCLDKNLTKNIEFVKKSKKEAENSFNNLLGTNCKDETKETFAEYLKLKDNFCTIKVDKTYNYQM